VTRVNTSVIHNTYVDRSVNKQVNANSASFNGPNGVKAEPTAEQKAAAANAKKMPATSQQLARQEAASKDHNLQASVNKGHPNQDAIKSFNKTTGQGAGATGVGAAPTGAGAGKAENKGGNAAAEQHAQGAGMNGEEHGNKHAAENHGNKHQGENLHGNKQNVEGNQAKAHSGKMAEHGGAAHAPHAMNQQMQHHPQPGGGNHQQQQGKKKQGKPDQPH
jgi:hypothetical protein